MKRLSGLILNTFIMGSLFVGCSSQKHSVKNTNLIEYNVTKEMFHEECLKYSALSRKYSKALSDGSPDSIISNIYEQYQLQKQKMDNYKAVLKSESKRNN